MTGAISGTHGWFSDCILQGLMLSICRFRSLPIRVRAVPTPPPSDCWLSIRPVLLCVLHTFRQILNKSNSFFKKGEEEKKISDCLSIYAIALTKCVAFLAKHGYPFNKNLPSFSSPLFAVLHSHFIIPFHTLILCSGVEFVLERNTPLPVPIDTFQLRWKGSTQVRVRAVGNNFRALRLFLNVHSWNGSQKKRENQRHPKKKTRTNWTSVTGDNRLTNRWWWIGNERERERRAEKGANARNRHSGKKGKKEASDGGVWATSPQAGGQLTADADVRNVVSAPTSRCRGSFMPCVCVCVFVFSFLLTARVVTFIDIFVRVSESFPNAIGRLSIFILLWREKTHTHTHTPTRTTQWEFGFNSFENNFISPHD